MAVKDWSTSALSNSTVGGVFIGEGMDRDKVNDGMRAMMAELRSYFDEEISVKNFGAIGDGVTDDTAAIQAAIAYAKTLSRPKLVVDRGIYLITSSLTFDLPNYSTIEFIGEIVTAGTLIPAVMIGSASTNTFGLSVKGLKVRRTANDTTGGSIGAQMRNIVSSSVHIAEVTGFQTGIDCYADQPNGGVSYCQFHLGYIQDNRYNLVLRETGSGYVNENLFFGGNFNHTSGYPAVSTINLWIQYLDYRHNNNRFFAPSFEDSSVLGVAAIINGDNNLILHPRMERPVSASTYEIQFTANSSENQLIGAGFSILPTNINDAGTGNIYETRQGSVIRKQAPTGPGNGVLRARGTVSDSARVYVAENTSGTATHYVQGDGISYSAAHGYFENGIRFRTSSGTLLDRGIFVGSGSPNTVVTAEPGSLYLNTTGGANTTLYVKESGSGNTGWVAK